MVLRGKLQCAKRTLHALQFILFRLTISELADLSPEKADIGTPIPSLAAMS
jgi:hypothetical protein